MKILIVKRTTVFTLEMHFPVLVKEDKVGKSQLNMFSSRVSPCPTTILPTMSVL